MKTPSPRTLVACWFGLSLAVVASNAGAGGKTIHWLLDPDNCFKDPKAVAVACGEVGTYHFYPAGYFPVLPATSCTGIATTESLAKVFPPLGRTLTTIAPGGTIPSQPVPNTPVPVGMEHAVRERALTAPTQEPWIPCAKGSCFDPHDQLGDRDWVAVVDWYDEHGWSVGWTIRSLLPPEVRLGLFPLLDARLDDTAEDGETTDVHVINALCRIIDEVPERAPLVVNMSFGHMPSGGNAPGECSQQDALQCEIGRLLGHLYRKPSSESLGTVLVAAAGNHHEMLFPAIHPAVIPAGMSDLEKLEVQVSDGAWETPDRPANKPLALLPSNGLCLSATVAGKRVGWGAPGGSSYSSAIFSAWMARVLQAKEVPNPLAPVLWSAEWWQPTANCGYHLRRGDALLASCAPAFKTLFDTAVLAPEWKCPTTNDKPYRPLVVATDAASLDEVQALGAYESLTEASDRINRPAPPPPPCISCDGPGRSSRTLLAPLAPLLAHRDEGALQLALHRNTPMPDDISFREVLLRAGKNFHRVVLSETQLKELAGTGYSHLQLTDTLRFLIPDEQPSLVFVVDWKTPNSGSIETYWTSAPILLLDPVP